MMSCIFGHCSFRHFPSGSRLLLVAALLHFLSLLPQSLSWTDLTTDRAREDILDAHNECRSREYTEPIYQKWVNQKNPPKTNSLNMPMFMIRLVYDTMLESYAREYSKYLCGNADRWGHSQKKPPYRVAPGENLYATEFDASKSSIPFNTREVVIKWWKERDYYDWASSNPNDKASKFGKPIGHYTQVVRAEASAVGCVLVSGCKNGSKAKWKTYVVCHYDYGNIGYIPYYNVAYPHTIPSRMRSNNARLNVCGLCPKGFSRCGVSLGKSGEDKRDAYLCLGFWDPNAKLPPPDLYKKAKEQKETSTNPRQWRAMIRNCEVRDGGCTPDSNCFRYGKSMSKLANQKKEPVILTQQCTCNKLTSWNVNNGNWWQRDRCLSSPAQNSNMQEFFPAFLEDSESVKNYNYDQLRSYQNSFLNRWATSNAREKQDTTRSAKGMTDKDQHNKVNQKISLMHQLADWVSQLTETERINLAKKYRPVALDVHQIERVPGYEDREVSTLEKIANATNTRDRQGMNEEEESLLDPKEIIRQVEDSLFHYKRNLALASFFANDQNEKWLRKNEGDKHYNSEKKSEQEDEEKKVPVRSSFVGNPVDVTLVSTSRDNITAKNKNVKNGIITDMNANTIKSRTRQNRIGHFKERKRLHGKGQRSLESSATSDLSWLQQPNVIGEEKEAEGKKEEEKPENSPLVNEVDQRDTKLMHANEIDDGLLKTDASQTISNSTEVVREIIPDNAPEDTSEEIEN